MKDVIVENLDEIRLKQFLVISFHQGWPFLLKNQIMKSSFYLVTLPLLYLH
jgi:hypothetical protein